DAYVLKGDYANAYKNHLRYADVNDSILNSDKINSISEMQTKYDTEKKAQEISLLNEQNKRKIAERNIFITGTFLFLLLAIAILLGLLQTKKAKKVSENLLLNILPEEVADELKVKGSAEAKYFEDVSVLFTDFKDFTQISERLNPKELVELLHTCFKAFDEIITKYDIEKIKTIGDSYMCAGGLPVPNKNSAYAVVCAGLEIQSFINHLGAQRIREGKEPIKMRLGIHTGPVVAGIVGVKKYSYDIWGDTVNTASRMESSGEPGKVNISGTTYEFIKDQFRCSYRGKVLAKHKGEIDMYFVEEIKSS
nr:adenylate/guanylate cyclase domain-containing protein [Chitinophagales bacterium]